MGIYLGIKLAKARPTPIVTLPNIIFPDSSLPFPLNTALLNKLKQFWDPIKKKVIPPAAYTEKIIKDWLNAIGYSLTHATEVQCPSREWSTQSTNSPIPQAELNRKPDIVLINSLIQLMAQKFDNGRESTQSLRLLPALHGTRTSNIKLTTKPTSSFLTSTPAASSLFL
jgi:hypothetical protein